MRRKESRIGSPLLLVFVISLPALLLVPLIKVGQFYLLDRLRWKR